MIRKTSRLITVYFIFLCCFHINAFPNDTDSLQNLLTTNLTDSARVDVMNALSKSLFNTNPESSLKTASSAKELAEKINYRPGLALAFKDMGISYYLEGKYQEAVTTWQDAIDVYKSIDDKTGVANMLSNQGAVYFNQGDDVKALELHLLSLKMSEELNDTLRVVTSLTNIGTVYLNKEATYRQALDYFLRAFKLSQVIKDDYLIGTSAVNLGETYYKLGDDSSALVYLYQSEKAYAGTENLPYTLNYIGRVYTRQKKFDKAIRIHAEAYDISKKLDTKLDQAQSLGALAQAYEAKGDYGLAIDAYKESIDIGTPLNAVTEIKDGYQGLSETYTKTGDLDKALKYTKLLLSIKDTIYNLNTAKKLGTMQLNFDLAKKQAEIKIQQGEIRRQKYVKYGFIGGFSVVCLFATVFFTQRNKIGKEKKRSEQLLLNILPEETAEELKETGTAKTKSFESVSVLFTDFKNFTIASEKLTPEELVAEINYCYSAFDRIVEKYGIEKIKTIGDSYMCAGGLPVTNTTHPFDIINAGLEMVQFIEDNKQERIAKGQPYFVLRCGIHTGPLVAGIVGIKKFAYDIWGDTVNTASRMESSGGVGKVNISGTTYEIVKNEFNCIHRGKIEAKNKGLIEMYFVEGKK